MQEFSNDPPVPQNSWGTNLSSHRPTIPITQSEFWKFWIPGEFSHSFIQRKKNRPIPRHKFCTNSKILNALERWAAQLHLGKGCGTTNPQTLECHKYENKNWMHKICRKSEGEKPTEFEKISIFPFKNLNWWNWGQKIMEVKLQFYRLDMLQFLVKFSRQELQFFLTKNSLICQLHKIFFQDGWLEKQIRIKWLSSVNQLWQSSTYHQFSWEIPVKFPSLRNCFSHRRKVAKVREVIDVLPMIIFHYFHPCLTCLSLLLFRVIQTTHKSSLPSPRHPSW